MKVLWFANTPCGASEKIAPNLVTGGWLKSLENEITKCDDIDLGVCFYWNVPTLPFIYKKTQFYPIYRSTSDSKVLFHLKKYLITNNDKNELLEMLKVISDFQPDIIHIHGTEDNFGLIQNMTNIPCIISIQGLLSPYCLKYYSGISKVTVKKFSTLKSILTFVPISIQFDFLNKRSLRERQILAISKNIIGRTAWDMRVTRVLSPDSRYFIGNEMLRSIFYKKQWKYKNDLEYINIVTVLGDAIYKGLETVVQTARIISKQNLFKFTWHIVGVSYHTPTVEIVSRWLNTNYINDNIILTGALSENQLVELLSESDLYCQCSHIENSPNSLCEAMIIGMPIVASFAGGTDSMLENNKEGILVQTGDYYSFAGALKFLIDNSILAKEYGKNARKRALVRHGSDKIVTELIDTYNKVISYEKNNI